MKSGLVALIGRPNAGKSTLLNTILKHKVAITSPKPQTTRFPIQAVYEDERGQIVFVDTPGIFSKTKDRISSRINIRTEETLTSDIDLILYVVDHTRERGEEENKTLGMIRKIPTQKLLIINKTDVLSPSYMAQYRFLEQEFDAVIEVSAGTRKNISVLLDEIFSRLPEGNLLVDTKNRAQPGLNIDSKTFIAEIIREKAFLILRKEVPYSMTAVVDVLEEKDNGVLYIRARILTSQDRYKGMIIGHRGTMIKEIGATARKELEVASGKKVYLELTVEVDTHWADYV